MFKFFLVFTFTLIVFASNAQNENPFRASFYNVENLFDIYDDSLTVDEEFLPEGKKFWTEKKYQAKLGSIAKVIVGIGHWTNIGILAMAEVENRQVLEDLIARPELKKQGLKIIHKQSPDRRGIDIGILYDPLQFSLTSVQFIKLIDGSDSLFRSRDMVYMKGNIFGNQEIHFFACHWPSRYGGQARSEPKRIMAAKLLRSKIDSIQLLDSNARILIMGDFNDEWNNSSLENYLKASSSRDSSSNKELCNLMAALPRNKGTHKYRGEWAYLDQIVVNQGFLGGNSKSSIVKKYGVVDLPFLLEEDDRNTGFQPNRTYRGYKYHGGFSDHLPIFIDILDKEN